MALPISYAICCQAAERCHLPSIDVASSGQQVSKVKTPFQQLRSPRGPLRRSQQSSGVTGPSQQLCAASLTNFASARQHASKVKGPSQQVRSPRELVRISQHAPLALAASPDQQLCSNAAAVTALVTFGGQQVSKVKGVFQHPRSPLGPLPVSQHISGVIAPTQHDSSTAVALWIAADGQHMSNVYCPAQHPGSPCGPFLRSQHKSGVAPPTQQLSLCAVATKEASSGQQASKVKPDAQQPGSPFLPFRTSQQTSLGTPPNQHCSCTAAAVSALRTLGVQHDSKVKSPAQHVGFPRGVTVRSQQALAVRPPLQQFSSNALATKLASVGQQSSKVNEASQHAGSPCGPLRMSQHTSDLISPNQQLLADTGGFGNAPALTGITTITTSKSSIC